MNPVSRFVSEIDEDLLDVENLTHEEKKINKNDYYNSEDGEYKVGDVVMHQIYGRGTVVSCDSSFVTIAFSKNYGIRKLLKSYKGLKKI